MAQNVREVYAGEDPPESVQTLEDAGISTSLSQRILHLTRRACTQILATLSTDVEKLLPTQIPVYALTNEFDQENNAAVCLSAHRPPAGRRWIENNAISDKRLVYFEGIALNFHDTEPIEDDRWLTSVLVHELLHAVLHHAASSSRSVCEMSVMTVQRAACSPIHGPGVHTIVPSDEKRVSGFRTDDFASFNGAQELVDLMYAHACKASAIPKANEFADAIIALALRAKEQCRIARFDEFAEVLEQHSWAKNVLASPVCKRLLPGSQVFSVLNEDRSLATSSIFEIRECPEYLRSQDPLSTIQYDVTFPDSQSINAEIIYDFGFYGQIVLRDTFEFSQESSGAMRYPFVISDATKDAIALINSPDGNQMLMQLSEEKRSQVAVSDLVRMTYKVSDHEFELQPKFD